MLTFTGCINNREYPEFFKKCISIPFVADTDFTQGERDLIEIAMMKWTFASHNAVGLSVKFKEPNVNWAFDNVPTIHKATTGWKKHIARKLENSLDVWGIAIINTGDIFIMTLNEKFGDLILHEVGHILIRSAGHSLDKRSIMYPYIINGQVIMTDDIENVRKVY